MIEEWLIKSTIISTDKDDKYATPLLSSAQRKRSPESVSSSPQAPFFFGSHPKFLEDVENIWGAEEPSLWVCVPSCFSLLAYRL